MTLHRSWFPWTWLVTVAVVSLGLAFSAGARAESIRQLASFAGVRSNELVGYGLVVGLDSTGDQTTQTPFTVQSLNNMFSQLGITVPPGTNVQLRDVAAVMVTASLPPFAAPGQRINVVVSAIGTATSLRGGTLLMTPLKGVNGATYAMAQGNVMVAGIGASANGSSTQVNSLNAGTIDGGALIERGVPLELGRDDGTLRLQLHDASFTTAQRVVTAINDALGPDVAEADNARDITLRGPANANARVDFMSEVDNLDVTPEAPVATVIINPRDGSVVMNEAVTLSPAAVAHGDITVEIKTANGIAQPAPFSQGQTVGVANSRIRIQQQTGSLNLVKGANLMQVVQALNALGATPNDLMSIIEALKAAGSLHAEVKII
ncbi:MAG TPA: flagellar basal body P-ring protein FlgI [Nevskiaceae bacterium]|nr:flagellar basal body P-ring protein FlgI [Nevskiaceae bacterium]